MTIFKDCIGGLLPEKSSFTVKPELRNHKKLNVEAMLAMMFELQ